MSRRAIRQVDIDEAPVDRRFALMLRAWSDDARALARVKERARRKRLAKLRAASRAA